MCHPSLPNTDPFRPFSRTLALALALLLYLPLSAVPAQSLDPSPAFRHLTDRDGLQYTWIWHIAQDARGYKWLSSKHGLFRYDGYSFDHFRFPNTADSSEVVVNCSVPSPDTDVDILLVGTDRGLYTRLPDGSFGHQELLDPASEGSRYISCGIWPAADAPWLGTADGVYRGALHNYSPTSSKTSLASISWEKIPTPSGVSPNISAFFPSPDGGVYVGTFEGEVWHVNPQGRPDTPLHLSSKKITAFSLDCRGRLWVSTQGDGVFILHHGVPALHLSHASGTLSHDIASSICTDAHGRIWIGTEHGISIFDPDNLHRKPTILTSNPTNRSSLNDNAVYALCHDSQDAIWVGTFFGGVNLTHPSFSFISDIDAAGPVAQQLHAQPISEIAAAPDGSMYIATETRGIFALRNPGNPLTQYDQTNSNLPNNNVHSLCLDPLDSSLWAGNYLGGLSRLTSLDSKFQPHPLPTGRSCRGVYRIFFDSAGNQWVGTYGDGLLMRPHGSREYMRLSDIPSSGIVWDLLQDQQGKIWVASYGEGLFRLDPAHNYRATRITSCQLPTCLLLLADGSVLVGTEHQGLTLVGPRDYSKIRHISTSQGLPDNTVYAALIDADSRLWLTTNSGLCVTDQALTSGKYTRYTVADGLPTNRFNYRSAARVGGTLYFGTVKGLVVVNPACQGMAPTPGPVSFTHLIINGRRQPTQKGTLSPAKELEIAPDVASWAVDFTSNSILPPSMQYRLSGRDEAWTSLPQGQNRASFNGVPPGHYTLQVRADGQERPALLPIYVRPHWYGTRHAQVSFTALVIIFLIGLTLLLKNNYKARRAAQAQRALRRNTEKLAQMKLGFFQNVSHEFKQPLTMIVGPVERLLDDEAHQLSPERRRYYLDVIKTNADRLLGLIGELLAFRELENMEIHPRRISIPQLLDHVITQYRWMFEAKDISLQPLICPADLWADTDPLMASRIVENLISNAAKYTPPGGSVSISASLSAAKIEITVSNTGTGLTPDQLQHIFDRYYHINQGKPSDSSGIGLQYARELAQLLGGSLTASSVPGNSVTFIFALPQVSPERSQGLVEADYHPADTAPIADIDIPSASTSPVLSQSLPQAYLEAERQATVLLVDDDLPLLDIAAEALGRYFNVITCSSFADAVALLWSDRNIDVVITDMMLGPDGETGLELCHKIKADQATSQIRVLITSVLSQFALRDQCYSAGADGFIEKPYQFSLLVSCVRHILLQRWQWAKSFQESTTRWAPPQSPGRGDDSAWLRKALDIVLQNVDNPDFAVDNLASEMAMSRSTLVRKLRALAQESPGEFILGIRLKFAARALAQSQQPVSDIALACGFSDSSYFSRAFRRRFGMTPSQYRAANANTSLSSPP